MVPSTVSSLRCRSTLFTSRAEMSPSSAQVCSAALSDPPQLLYSSRSHNSVDNFINISYYGAQLYLFQYLTARIVMLTIIKDGAFCGYDSEGNKRVKQRWPEHTLSNGHEGGQKLESGRNKVGCTNEKAHPQPLGVRRGSYPCQSMCSCFP
jgi:hypothetical protein